jgi:peroxiredoxin
MSLYDVKVSNGFASRDTIVINPSGYLVKIYRNVKPAGHAREVLEFINQYSTLQN